METLTLAFFHNCKWEKVSAISLILSLISIRPVRKNPMERLGKRNQSYPNGASPPLNRFHAMEPYEAKESPARAWRHQLGVQEPLPRAGEHQKAHETDTDPVKKQDGLDPTFSTGLSTRQV